MRASSRVCVSKSKWFIAYSTDQTLAHARRNLLHTQTLISDIRFRIFGAPSTHTLKHPAAPDSTMPKNKGKGGKNRRRGKNENESEKRELIFKEDEQEYAQVTKMLGNGRLEAMCFDGVKRLCHIRGKLRKKVSIRWIRMCGSS